MKKSIFSRVKLAGLLVLFVCTWTFFAGCKNAPEDAPSGSDTTQQQTPSGGETQNPETNPSQENNLLKALLGTWMSQYNDGYTITKTTVTYDDGGYGYGWEAELADVTDSYIYVKKADEEFVAISYKDLTSASCSMATAYKEGGKASTKTLEEAKTEFTVENGYFGYYGEYIKQ